MIVFDPLMGLMYGLGPAQARRGPATTQDPGSSDPAAQQPAGQPAAASVGWSDIQPPPFLPHPTKWL